MIIAAAIKFLYTDDKPNPFSFTRSAMPLIQTKNDRIKENVYA